MEFLLSITFIIWITVCLFAFFYSKTNTNTIIKFIGGFTVSLIAVHANNTSTYFLSIVITGLIIASEKFMSILVALLRGNSDLWKNDMFMKTLEKMSPEEVRIKKDKEIKEIKKTIDEESIPKSTPAEKLKYKKTLTRYMESVPELEKKALAKFEKLNGVLIREQVKIGNLSLDGVGINKEGNKLYFFEVKIIPDKNPRINDGDLSEKILHLLRNTVPNILSNLENDYIGERYKGFANYVLMIVIVVDSNRNLGLIMEKIGSLKLVYNEPSKKISVHFTFYNADRL